MPNPDITLTLIGGPTLLIETNGARLLTDPTFDAPGSYQAGAISLHKLTPPALAADAIGEVDAVLLSHDQHFDNFDHAGRAFAARGRKTYVTPAGAVRLGGNAEGLAPWQTTALTARNGQRLHITSTPARHGPVGIEPISGDVTGFLVGREAPGDLLYISGDTVWYEGVAEVARRFDPKIVVVFAGSAEPRGHFHLTMDSNDVIATAHAFPRAKILAIHNEGWEHFKESAADLGQAMQALGIGDRLLTLERGRPVTFKV